jgi:hypothetical protein
VSSESETDKENTVSNNKRRLEYSSDEEKTVETPARFKNSFKLRIHDDSSSMERKKPVSC